MIYCVEDDDSIRQLVLYTLRASGFEAEGFTDGPSMLVALAQRPPALILLDVMLPGMDGLEILRQVRAVGDVPVIMATARGTEYDKVMALDAGADDYLAKPFGMMEMISRVRAVLRRTGSGKERTLSLGELSMSVSEHIVSVGGERVALTLKEFDLLRLFLERIGQVFTRDQLLEAVWGSGFCGETRTVDVHIGTLRTKLGAAGRYIRTVRGVGYRMESES